MRQSARSTRTSEHSVMWASDVSQRSRSPPRSPVGSLLQRKTSLPLNSSSRELKGSLTDNIVQWVTNPSLAKDLQHTYKHPHPMKKEKPSADLFWANPSSYCSKSTRFHGRTMPMPNDYTHYSLDAAISIYGGHGHSIKSWPLNQRPNTARSNESYYRSNSGRSPQYFNAARPLYSDGARVNRDAYLDSRHESAHDTYHPFVDTPTRHQRTSMHSEQSLLSGVLLT